MADLGETFDHTTVPPSEGAPDPVPPGEYNVMIVDSDVVEASTRKGDVLKFTASIFDGPYEGRKIFENLNIRNESVKAQAIGRGDLSALCHAIGLAAPASNSVELHDQPFTVRVKLTPAEGKFAAKNEITKYMPYAPNGGGVSAPAPTAQQATQASTGTGATPPWQKNRAAGI